MSRRDQIKMTDREIRDYLAEQRVINVATMGPNGRPHLAPLWYVPHGGGDTDGGTLRLETWTYGRSQKVANLRRLAQATLLVESGEAYEELRGVSMETDVEIIDDTERTLAIGTDLMRRYTFDGAEIPDEAVDALRAQATKRVGLVFTPTKIVTWDHSKLGGTY
ncbi:pyridoxamine 5'-phosphate oxidase family protein [Haloechinothrix sp. YIM 98757]|uniref:Pyridoxamine 5'-phosphate oxidase family protein n=1 Tax=Haloechinothrix aidingensis TaxID=2752311 RepID=A0A838AEC3_9PSEU|nr:pyridoxamine 5'-phosphate oxidase family protein [Haloechinothrix aidingensis]MBA0127560.1 pyridoxamine 5'-phosphate oxidase family protein [Haloechinothrix aidingensis]